MTDTKTIPTTKPNAAMASDNAEKAPAIVRGVRRGGQAVGFRKSNALRLEFAQWVIAPDRRGTQRQWAASTGFCRKL